MVGLTCATVGLTWQQKIGPGPNEGLVKFSTHAMFHSYHDLGGQFFF